MRKGEILPARRKSPAAGSTVNMLDIVNKYDKMNVIPYIKLTLDYLFFFSDETALGLGLYIPLGEVLLVYTKPII